MKKNYFLIIFCFITYFTNAQAPFITTWQVEEGDLTIDIPIVEDDNIPDSYTVDFGDGTVLTNQSGEVSHTYTGSGIYTVTISGNFTKLNISTDKLLTIEQWGDIQWTSMYEAFSDCLYLNITATDVPNLSNVTNMSRMFYGCLNFNSPIGNWDVSNVTNMSYTFYSADFFNQPINDWDVSNVTDMSYMFCFTTFFNQPLNNWDVSNVTNMARMFTGIESFNQPLNNWDVSNVTNMSRMFDTCQSFNQPLSDWDVSNVTDMFDMFNLADSFNQPLNNWDVSNVTNMSGMFSSAISFNQPLNNWDVSNVTDMSNMFYNANSFNQPLNNWNISNVVNLMNMFYSANSFNQPLNNWDFNNDLYFVGSFVRDTGLSIENYDTLLSRFAQLGIENKTLYSYGLEYCNSGLRTYLVNELGWSIQGDSLSENCDNNILSGSVFLDGNNDGCDMSDIPTIHFMVNTNNGVQDYTSITNNEGGYNLNLFEGTYEVTMLNIPDYFIATPSSSTITFDGANNEQELNFCLTATQVIDDLNITLLPVEDARPGFESDYQLIVENMGTQTVANATVTVTFDEALQTFVEATLEATTTTSSQLTFNLENLLPFENRIINFIMQTFTPPTVNGGEIAGFTATVTPDTNDNTPDDNTFVLEQEIVNSFDPNDKRVVQGEEIFIEQASEYLDYIIRFQNTGTASAITVRIEDTLSENLDWTTFKPISASHDYTVQITGGNQIEFIFNNINLPHEAADEPGSHGFIAYKIKPVEGLEIGDVINGNTAGIYFDYNLPIVTNATTTEIVEVLKTNDFVLNNQITVYPNPVNNILHIETKSGVQLEGAKIYNLQGSQLMSLNQDFENINTESLSSGIYLLSIQTNKGSAEYKLVKN